MKEVVMLSSYEDSYKYFEYLLYETVRTIQTYLIPYIEPIENIMSDRKNNVDIYLDGQYIKITRREAECLYHLLRGLSAKQTASLMHLSVRTIEGYLNNLKTKAKCRTKTALIGKLQSSLIFLCKDLIDSSIAT